MMRARSLFAVPSPRVAAAVCTALLAPLAARAASPEAVPVSPEAALTANAVLASDDVGGGGWYNPASLGAVRRSSVQVGASAYSESATVISDAQRATVPWSAVSGDIRSLSYASVPSVLSYTFKLREGLGISLGVWTPYHDYDGGSSTISSAGVYPTTPPRTPALNGAFTQTYAFTERRDDTWGGIGVGWQATSRLRIGGMIQGAYSTDVWTVDLNTSLKTDSTNPAEGGSHLVYSERGDVAIIGLRTMFGLQWDATSRLRVAAAVRGPTIRVGGWGPVNKFLSTAVLLPGLPPGEGQVAQETKPPRGVSAVEPVRLYGAVRWAWDVWTVAVEGDWHPALDGEFGAFKEAWNFRAGGTWRYGENLLLGAGIFHDAASSGASALQTSLSYTGFTTGAVYRSKAVVKALKGGNDWDLLGCVALRGAYGWGTYRGISIDQRAPAPSQGEAAGVVSFPDASAKVFEGSISFLTAIIF